LNTTKTVISSGKNVSNSKKYSTTFVGLFSFLVFLIVGLLPAIVIRTDRGVEIFSNDLDFLKKNVI